MTVIKRAVIAVGILSLLAGLFGCVKPEWEASHNADDIISVSAYCSHMDFSYSYSFSVRKEESGWLFDAACFIHDHSEQIELSDKTVSDEDIKELLSLISENGTIKSAENYKKPIESPFQVLDETAYGICIGFSDGTDCNVGARVDGYDEIERFFYRLAETLE